MRWGSAAFPPACDRAGVQLAVGSPGHSLSPSASSSLVTLSVPWKLSQSHPNTACLSYVSRWIQRNWDKLVLEHCTACWKNNLAQAGSSEIPALLLNHLAMRAQSISCSFRKLYYQRVGLGLVAVTWQACLLWQGGETFRPWAKETLPSSALPWT